nr:PREDICTED: receptor-type tyrosine-protein phosphatase-like [Bemisia tabaci]XP_018908232.1 PREDICTED: receptor-type tyrosine-protein phosphatase-like [Bemisia tabaci]XP_018908241.1 PREDICTED: receptor-type tyrosine-protein phosphatase-like [Bemisia tabaci]XP_018908250.1 PREDICTED: receptor-type tyrosine-protein phosphatase-like [Bemisia tabaci]XP_018908257.1 PREDICTED: receptor-type tyrosine-protein phosphatase-like [Bemisia tabaci]XP_018908265.1 PREDICTED: receptor-type tyrosine-protein pho
MLSNLLLCQNHEDLPTHESIFSQHYLPFVGIDNDVKMGVLPVDNTIDQSELYFKRPWRPDWTVTQLTAFVGVSVGFLLLILVWLRRQMSAGSSPEIEDEKLKEENKPSLREAIAAHEEPVIEEKISPLTLAPLTTTPPLPPVTTGLRTSIIQSSHLRCETIKKKEIVLVKTKGLLERRGSSANLTIGVLHPSEKVPPPVTPTKECTAEEYLMSVGNVLSRSQLKSSLNDIRGLHKEFWDIPLNHPEKSTVAGCGVKNRYRTILPNDKTRVRINGDETLDGYINANFIKGFGDEKAFIATQGPLPNTVIDFWSMVWCENVPAIVMITRLLEKSCPKCEAYFPTGKDESCKYGEISVTVQSIQIKGGYVIRKLDVQKDDETRCVLHFWYDSWPDHKAPPNLYSLLYLIKDVELSRFCLPLKFNSPGPARSPRVRKASSLEEDSISKDSCRFESESPVSLRGSTPILPCSHLSFDQYETETYSDSPFFTETRSKEEEVSTLSDNYLTASESLYSWDDALSSPNVKGKKSSPLSKDDERKTEVKYSPLVSKWQSSLESVDEISCSSEVSSSVPSGKKNSSDDSALGRYYPSSAGYCESPRGKTRSRPFFFNFENVSLEKTKSLDNSQLSCSLSKLRKPDSSPSNRSDVFSFENLSIESEEPEPRSKPKLRRATEMSTDSSIWSQPSPDYLFEVYGSPSSEAPEVQEPQEMVSSASVSFSEPTVGTKRQGPVVVHCSAGVGRTGCFIAISLGCSQLRETNSVDVLGIVSRMRCDRGGMVQSAEQYECIHRALALFEQCMPEETEGPKEPESK